MNTSSKPKPFRTAAAAAGLACIIAITGCSASKANEDREVITKPDKTITVVSSEPAKAEAGIDVGKIDKLDGVRGMDWISDELLVITKPNDQANQLTFEGTTRYPNNLYIRNVTTGADELLKQADLDQYAAIVSPDKKHLFFKQDDNGTVSGFIMDLSTREVVQTGTLPLGLVDAEWVDNERLLFTTESGDIARSDLTGATEIIVEAGHPATINTKQIGSTIYYIGPNYTLYAYDTQATAKEKKVLATDVVWFIPSPDGKQFAVVKKVNKDEDPLKMELVLTDTALKTKKSIAKGNQIFGTSWSPDGTRLAYTVMNSDGGTQGIYVADAVSGETKQITVDAQYVSDTLRWNQAGNKVMAVTSSFVDNAIKFVTYVTTLK
ncbi:TolB protein [Paenibacillus phyllosphaerae]|uniref:TolB protein n=1 Tax=Paenibacillus phyllosphaerae TaxID=274593 RepID=A0A7W5ATG9_9BACL|nr:PD40 domain-containing protein [Paenibacillus phyllosphaerae]MBB3108470.1 TolB protein [Paenibacillus phyllosphaerae]